MSRFARGVTGEGDRAPVECATAGAMWIGEPGATGGVVEIDGAALVGVYLNEMGGGHAAEWRREGTGMVDDRHRTAGKTVLPDPRISRTSLQVAVGIAQAGTHDEEVTVGAETVTDPG